MSTQNAAIGGVHLNAVGLSAVQGSPDDWAAIRRARKEHTCSHHGPWSGRIDTPCTHPVIKPGETYLITKQGYLDTSPLAVECALASGRVVRMTRTEVVAHRATRKAAERYVASFADQLGDTTSWVTGDAELVHIEWTIVPADKGFDIVSKVTPR